MGVGTHPSVPRRVQNADLFDRFPGVVEELLRAVAAQPVLQDLPVAIVFPCRTEGNLVGAPGPFHVLPVHFGRAGPSFGGTQHNHRPAGPFRLSAFVGTVLDLPNVIKTGVQCSGEILVHLFRIVTLNVVGSMPVAAQQVVQLVMVNPCQDGGTSDLVAIEVQDRQNGSVACGIHELIGVPAGCQRAGFRLPVAHHGRNNKVGVVEGCPVGV